MTAEVVIDRLEVDLGQRSYPIVIGPGLLRGADELDAVVRARDVLIVTNDRIGPLYLDPVVSALEGRRIAAVTLQDGEAFKTLATVAQIIDALVEHRMNRDCAVLALGGGVVGDITGFAAACYQRGVDYIQLPTSLLAQVDSSVGGKTGVNHPGGKNLIGAFHQPRAVLADTETLRTLADREYAAGLAEVVKYGLIYDAGFFAALERDADRLVERDTQVLVRTIKRCCQIKAEIVGADERETGVRALLNLGHTFGHAIETGAGYGRWLHGEAVAAGIVMAARLSQRVGWLGEDAVGRARALLTRFGLPVDPPRLGSQYARGLMAMDKKVTRGRLRLVLLRAIGEAVVSADFPESELAATLQESMD